MRHWRKLACVIFFSIRAMHDDTAIQIKNMHVNYTLVKYFFHTKLSPISLSSSSPSPPVNFFIAWSTHCVPASGPLSMCKKLFPRATYKNHITHKCKVHRESANWKLALNLYIHFIKLNDVRLHNEMYVGIIIDLIFFSKLTQAFLSLMENF